MENQQENLLTRTLLVIGFCAVLLIPLMAYGCGPEWARWDAAQAVMAYEQGDVEGAIEQLEAAVEKSPRDPILKLSLAEKLIQSNQPFQAERICDEILKRFPDNDPALVRKANSQQAQGNFKKAFETFQQRAKARSWLVGNSFNRLNERAYYRALANVELENALDDIDASIQMVSRSRFGNLDHSVAVLSRSLVASALIGRRIGMTEQVIQRLTPSIDRLRIAVHENTIELNRQVILQSTKKFPPSIKASKSYNVRRDIIRSVEKTLALLLTTRALCYQDLGNRIALLNQDRAEVRSMALDADKILADLPEENECIRELLISYMLLDTRGLVLSLMSQQPKKSEPRSKADSKSDSKMGSKADSKMGSELDSEGNAEDESSKYEMTQSYSDALVDLNQAIFAYQVFAKSLDSDVHNHLESLVQPHAMKLGVPKGKAVLLYHRMLLLEKMGDEDAAEQDSETIRQLGFSPGWHLF